MIAIPLLLPLVWLAGVLALVVLGLGAFLVVGFVVGAVTGTVALAVGIALLAIAFLGRWLVLLTRPTSPDEPSEDRTGAARQLPRPDGTELRMESYGRIDAPTIVLTHGWGSDSTQWYYLKRALSDRFRVIVWDLRGLGRSTTAPTNDYSLDAMAADLEAVLEAAGDRRTIVVGHSMGGMVILRLCRRMADLDRKVAGLVLANTTHIDPVRTTAAGKLLVALERPVIVPLARLTQWLFPLVWLMTWLSYLNGTMHLMLALTGFAGTETRGQLDRVATIGVKQHPGVLARQGLAMLDHNEVDTLFSVSVPVLVLRGDRDRVTVPQASEEMHRKAPASELVTLEPSGHVSVFERHAEFSRAVASFGAKVANP
jgi:pimeloyl-ACP methyl ester carboxylesterase